MSLLVRRAAALCAELELGERLRLAGGLAVELHVGSGARVTGDVDFVAMDDATHRRVLEHLRSAGFAVGKAVGWWRAVRGGDQPMIVDVSSHPIVDVASFDSFRLRGEPRPIQVGNAVIWLVDPDDLALMKLAAARAKDLVDLVVLTASVAVSARSIAERAAADDVERLVSRGGNRLRHALASGDLGELLLESLGRGGTENELVSIATLAQDLLAEGL